MPSEPPISSLKDLPRGILLVEEYNALGVAISSALKKFAPHHGVQVAHSFAEAKTIAAAMRPELFILDLDPPPAGGEIEFFNKLKSQFPEARVLVIATGTSRELRAQRGTAGAIQFIDKPFDLAEFGAAVQALLGPWALPPAAEHRGTLRDLDVVDIVQLKCLAGSTAVVRVETAGGEIGEIHFRKGQICHALAGTTSGAAALEEIVSWTGAKLSESEAGPNVPRTIDEAWSIILLRIVRQRDEEIRRQTGRPGAPGPPAPRKNGKKILVVDDTEMLLIFVADVLATADPNFQIFTAASGAEGLEVAGKARPDLILLDYSLTDMTGDKVCRALGDDPETARIPILMMSGHLSELARTAELYANVVTTLPKPFLSGALISAVEKVLAAGPLSKTATPKPEARLVPCEAVSALAGSPLSPVSDHAPVLPNGDGMTKPPVNSSSSTPAPLAIHPAGMEPPPLEKAAPPPANSPTPIAAQNTFPSAPIHRPTELDVTLSLSVVNMQFTPSFRLHEASLQLFNRIVAVTMGDEKELKGVPPESGFRLGRATVGETGRFETLRLVPMRQPPQLPEAQSFFAVGESRVQHTNSQAGLKLSAPAQCTMSVRVTASFELLAVELSVGFEVVAILLRVRETTVLIRNAGASAGRRFELVDVQLDPSSELGGLLVRAIP